MVKFCMIYIFTLATTLSLSHKLFNLFLSSPTFGMENKIILEHLNKRCLVVSWPFDVERVVKTFPLWSWFMHYSFWFWSSFSLIITWNCLLEIEKGWSWVLPRRPGQDVNEYGSNVQVSATSFQLEGNKKAVADV